MAMNFIDLTNCLIEIIIEACVCVHGSVCASHTPHSTCKCSNDRIIHVCLLHMKCDHKRPKHWHIAMNFIVVCIFMKRIQTLMEDGTEFSKGRRSTMEDGTEFSNRKTYFFKALKSSCRALY